VWFTVAMMREKSVLGACRILSAFGVTKTKILMDALSAPERKQNCFLALKIQLLIPFGVIS